MLPPGADPNGVQATYENGGAQQLPASCQMQLRRCQHASQWKLLVNGPSTYCIIRKFPKVLSSATIL